MPGSNIFNDDYANAHTHRDDPSSPTNDHEILVIIICVLATVLFTIIVLILYHTCKAQIKKRRNPRHISGCLQSCTCRTRTGCSDHFNAHRDVSTRHFPPFAFHHHNFHSPCHRNPSLEHIQEIQSDPTDHYPGYDGSPRHTYEMTRPVLNPAYVESVEDIESVSLFDQSLVPVVLKDLYKETDRSLTQTICGKLVVSIARRVCHKGAVLYLDNMGISLNIPEGAIKEGHTRLIVLVLNWDLTDNPQMKLNESLVSPVVYVGPHGLKLDKPCTLIFRHCAFNPRQIKVMRTETELIDTKDWSTLCNQSDDSDICHLTPDECRLKIDTFTLYTCVQAPIDNCPGKKWLQIAVFACPLRKEINHHQVRIYFLNKTNCALQWAIQNEANFGGRLICPEKVFLFDGNDLDMITVTSYLDKGWEMVDQENVEKISFLKIWHGQCPHISVCYRRSNSQRESSASVAIEMTLRVFTYQQTLEDNGEKISIQVFEDNKTPITENERRCNHQIEIQINNYGSSQSNNYGSSQSNNYGSSQSSREEHRISTGTESSAGIGENRRLSESVPYRDEIENRNSDNVKLVINNQFSACAGHADNCDNIIANSLDAKPRLFPHALRNQLILLLDPRKAPYGNDWRDLASELKLDNCIPKLELEGHPTDSLLSYIESQGQTYDEAISLFRKIGREDCVQEIRKHLKTENAESVEVNFASSREASENTCRYDANENSRLHSEEFSSTGSSQHVYYDTSRLKTDSYTISKSTDRDEQS